MRLDENKEFKDEFKENETSPDIKHEVKEEVREEIKEDILSEIKKPEEPPTPKKPAISIKKPKLTPPKLNWWAVMAVLFFVLFVASVFTGGFSSISGMSASVAGERAIDFLNNNLLPAGMEATLVDVEPKSGVYSLTLDIAGKEYNSYITKDGSLFFVSGIELKEQSEEESTDTNASEKKATFDASDSKKPKVQLFIMSFCPYGQQAEKNIAPAIELLKDYIDFEPHFIVRIDGDTVSSLHGSKEAEEDKRQACIWKYHPDKWWDYVLYVDENIPLNNIEEKWKEAAEEAGLDADEIESCASEEGLDLLKADNELTTELGITGSPTLLINGDSYTGQRTPEAYKQAICSGFTEQPDVCSETLENGGSSSSGNC